MVWDSDSHQSSSTIDSVLAANPAAFQSIFFIVGRTFTNPRQRRTTSVYCTGMLTQPTVADVKNICETARMRFVCGLAQSV